MTGATGDLTPDETGTRPFVPAESREIADPEHHADVTEAQSGVSTVVTDEAEPVGQSREPDLGGDERTDHEDHF